ncbi:MAG: hypothetical protein ACT4PI_13830 [Actinomycetota bacterium]
METYCAPAAPTTAARYQAAFDGVRAANAGYFVASDGGVPNPLPDGRILWFFGDTVLGRWTPGGPVSPYLGLANNAFVVQDGRCFRPIIEPIPDLPGSEWIWPTGSVVQGSELLVFGLHMKPAPGPFPFEFVRVDVVTFSLPSLTMQGPIRALPVPTSPNYGETVFSDGTDVYAYGRIRQGFLDDHHFVARAPVASLFTGTAWQYWKDDDIATPGDASEGWSSNAADRDPMAFEGSDADPMFEASDGPVAGFPVAPWNGAYLGSALHFDVIPADLETWHDPGDDPSGPWTVDAQIAVDVPDYTQGGSGRYAYGGRVVLTLPGLPSPIALWSVNHQHLLAVRANPELYKVIFAVPDGRALAPP